MPTRYTPSRRSRVKRAYQRASYDQEAVFAVLDAAQMINVGYVIDGQPYVTPTFHWRDGNTIFWHGSSASKMLRQVRTGVPVCVTAAIFDGYVLARSPLHHSANYRTVMAFGKAKMITGRAAKEAALKATTVVAMSIEEVAAKTRSGGPIDDEADYDTVKVWSGELPALHPYGTPVADSRLDPNCPLPDYLDPYRGR